MAEILVIGEHAGDTVALPLRMPADEACKLLIGDGCRVHAEAVEADVFDARGGRQNGLESAGRDLPLHCSVRSSARIDGRNGHARHAEEHKRDKSC